MHGREALVTRRRTAGGARDRRESRPLARRRPRPERALRDAGGTGGPAAGRRRGGPGRGPGGVAAALLAAFLLSGCGGEPAPPAGQGTRADAGPVDPRSGKTPTVATRVKDALDRGVNYLHDQFDLEKGGWTVQGKVEPGITALVVQALARSPRKYRAEDGPFMARSLEMLASLAREDGSIHDGELANYKTSAAVQALAAAGGERFREVVEKGRRYLIGIQLDEGEGFSEEHKFYGGAGYGGDRRPDLSNLSIWTDGLLAAGEKPGSEPFRRALTFLERCQNDSETNTMRHEVEGKIVVSGDDGGAGYAPGDSKAGLVDLGDGTFAPRSYGSMTYALLKGYMAADLPRDDPRVKRAIDWIRRNFTLEENPGFDTEKNPGAGQQGLYYYYYTMAKALDLYGADTVQDARGREHRWRDALAERLLALQQPDGSWANRESRWWEGMPVLATTYAVLALEMCLEGSGP